MHVYIRYACTNSRLMHQYFPVHEFQEVQGVDAKDTGGKGAAEKKSAIAHTPRRMLIGGKTFVSKALWWGGI